mmetsp:Transcript_73138/g.165884  ORF Transcript_73138/g.165884 Transcript_73138/m.165884 type:complete len:555 (+) Transcript_73138:62-1726(+)
MVKRKREEKPTDAFEKLRQCFDIIKANHSDPWNWHEYLAEEPKDKDEEDEVDPEKSSLKPKARGHVEKLKSHLLATVAELNRAASAADMCYFHMCCSPQAMKDCCVILGTSGDIDEDMLAGGDVSPQKILAALQEKLTKANDRIAELDKEVTSLKDSLVESHTVSQERFTRWQNTAMLMEEAITRLHWMKLDYDETLRREAGLQAAYRDLYHRWLRASRLMIYKGRQWLRDKVFVCNKKETLYYSFYGFLEILQKEKEERERQEAEEERDATEFALRNEVRLLLRESSLYRGAIQKLGTKNSLFRKDRRQLACRILHKHRPYIILEYYLWVWELWQPIRRQLVLEKNLEGEQDTRDAISQSLVQTSAQLPLLAERIEQLREAMVAEQVAHDESRRSLTAESARQLATLSEHLRVHRMHELAVLARLHQLDNESMGERIAILEREIAEDKHIQSLKGMVVDLESNLRRALDRRKQRPYVVQPGSGTKCVHCGRESMFNGWRGLPKSLSHSMSEADLGRDSLSMLSGRTTSPRIELRGGKLLAGDEKSGTFSAVWR